MKAIATRVNNFFISIVFVNNVNNLDELSVFSRAKIITIYELSHFLMYFFGKIDIRDAVTKYYFLKSNKFFAVCNFPANLKIFVI